MSLMKQKLYGEDACPSHNQCQTLAGLSLGVGGSGLVRWVSCRVRVSWVSFMVMCMLAIVAPPIVVGAWSMVFLLREHYFKRGNIGMV